MLLSKKEEPVYNMLISHNMTRYVCMYVGMSSSVDSMPAYTGGLMGNAWKNLLDVDGDPSDF